MPKGRDAGLGARPPCETLCETNECTSAKHCRRSRAGTLVLTKYSQLYIHGGATVTGAIPGRTQAEYGKSSEVCSLTRMGSRAFGIGYVPLAAGVRRWTFLVTNSDYRCPSLALIKTDAAFTTGS